MKKILLVLLLMGTLTVIPTQRSHAIVWVVVKAALKKVIRQIDLGIQRQQNKVIWMQNAQKNLENTMSRLKLKEISEWSDKQRQLYDQYFKELWKIKNAIHTYQEVRAIIRRQASLVDEYSHAWSLLQKDGRFTLRELRQMYHIYSGILEESVKSIEELTMVVSSLTTQMGDGRRLELIASVSRQLEQNLVDLRRFNNQNFRISLSRAASADEQRLIKELYGLAN
ncbi:conjugal transfer protein TraI [Chitinophaga varians]|uniref:Conjugal transfer protein TraI n=1 Tax=Chitinophaga varians TaxID=2202339 RepID=A0A847S296_9BACT|nr:conjugal transfer protein TraI [Chitinophaga varians]NLR68514.1 conjugal transfer protein TraI [Chitinophaga varians]